VQLAKLHLDVGLMTNALEPMRAFWQQQVGLVFEEMLPLGGGLQQYRHAMNGSVLKLNHVRDPLPPARPSGYRAISIARDGQSDRRKLRDPDGNVVVLVPRGEEGVHGIAVELGVRDVAAFHRFYGHALGFERTGERAYRCGDTLLRFSHDPEAPSDAAWIGLGFRYLTIQVWDVDREHRGILERGGAEGRPPLTLGTVARVSFVRDPDGNWIEISQRASLTGPLPG
jgi:lactoylglutathione lyase